MLKLTKLLNPKSIAIVGVSNNPSKLGSLILSNIINSGYEGKIFPVNPKYDSVLGMKCYKSISEIQDEIDIVCIVVPAEFVLDIVEESGKKGIPFAVIISSGFGETGSSGMSTQEQLLQTAKAHNIRIIGPNCLGEIIPSSKLNLSFAMTNAIEGDIAFLTQSGAFLTAGLDLSLNRNLGFSYMVSIGNKIDLNEDEFVEEWIHDPKVKVIGAYLEDINSGKEFSNIYRNSKTQKPLVVFKPGESDEGSKAISSHTGSIVGSHQAYTESMKDVGITVATDIEDLFNYLCGFSWSKLPKGNRIGIVTNAGGIGVIATDYLVKKGFQIPEISQATRDIMSKDLPASSNLHNPIDIIGDADAKRYEVAIQALVNSNEVDSIFVYLTPQIVTQIEETAKIIINFNRVSEIPIIPVFIGGRYIQQAMTKFYDEKVLAFTDIGHAINTLKVLLDYSQFHSNSAIKKDYENFYIKSQHQRGVHREELLKFLTSETAALPEELVRKLAIEIGLDLPRQEIISTLDEAKLFANDKYPVVLKATTESIAHKSDKKALFLDIRSEADLIEAFGELSEIIKANSNSELPKILIQEQIIGAEEVFVGANRDGRSDVYLDNTPGFGHIIAFGKGGIYTEIYSDIQYSIVVSERQKIINKFNKSKISKIIHGARGKDPYAFEKIIDLIECVQKLVLLYPEIESLDLNPVLVTKERAIAVDFKIFIRK